MDASQRKSATYFGLTLVLLFAGILIGVMISTDTSKTQTIKSEASEEPKTGVVEIISPPPGGKISNGEIKARFENGEDISKLTAVYKVDDESAQKLQISRIDSTKILLSGVEDVAKLASGRHTLNIYVYSSQSSSNTLVGSAVFYFNK